MLNFFEVLFLGWLVSLLTLILATMGLLKRDFRFLIAVMAGGA